MDMLWCQIRELFENVSIDGVRRIVSEMISLAEWGAKDGAITPNLSNDQQNYAHICWYLLRSGHPPYCLWHQYDQNDQECGVLPMLDTFFLLILAHAGCAL